MIRVSDLIDSYRDLLTGALDVYLSTVSNRLNVVMERLTIVATIFLPLSVLTGFFGMNFAWMVRHVDTFAAFALLGVGGVVVSSLVLLVLFWRAGYLGGRAARG
jgi:magnesium transporter